jgi:hypothetical protein
MQESSTMALERVAKLIKAYYHFPLKEYAEIVSQIRNSGGLTNEEVKAIKTEILEVDSRTVVRQTGAFEKAQAQ